MNPYRALVCSTGGTYTHSTTGTGAIFFDEPGTYSITASQLRKYFPPTKAPMLETQYCPLCKSHAVRDDQGRDEILHTLKDHKPQPDLSTACATEDWQETGVVLRIRVCATCGNIWASRTPAPKEIACTPGK